MHASAAVFDGRSGQNWESAGEPTRSSPALQRHKVGSTLSSWHNAPQYDAADGGNLGRCNPHSRGTKLALGGVLPASIVGTCSILLESKPRLSARIVYKTA